MASIFYSNSFERRFPLSFLFIEHVNAKLEKLEHADDAAAEKALMESISACLGISKVSTEDVEYAALRLEEASQGTDPSKEDGDKKPTKKSFATSFADWVTSLQPEDLCLVISGFDYKRARQLYSEVDYKDVTRLSSVWMDKEWEYIKVGYESVVYGFGGGYDDNASNASVIDVSADDHLEGKVISSNLLDAVKF